MGMRQLDLRSIDQRVKTNVEVLCELHGISYAELARRTGWKRPTIIAIQNGDIERGWTHGETQVLAEALGEPLERLTGPELVLVAVPADSVGPAGIEPATTGPKTLLTALVSDENAKAA